MNDSPAALARCFALACALLGGAAQAAPETLRFLTWADYLDETLAVEFERETGVRIEFSYFESDDARDEILAESDGRGFDLVLVNGLLLEDYAMRGWLAPVEPARIPNLRHLEARWRSAFPASERYAVPYFWGTLGIGFRRDLAGTEFRSWGDFFRPAERLRGRITLLKSNRDVLGMALKSLGYSANTTDRERAREAGRLLGAQRPFVRSYEYVSLGPDSALVTGEVWAALMYSGDALMVREHNEHIAYVVPDEGGNLWVDYLATLQSSPRKDLAAQFIDFLNRPTIAARNAEYVYYATPNLAAREHLPSGYFEDPVIFPPPDVLARSEVYRPLPPRTQRTFNMIYGELVN